MLKYAKYFDVKPLEEYLDKKLISTKANNTPFEVSQILSITKPKQILDLNFATFHARCSL